MFDYLISHDVKTKRRLYKSQAFGFRCLTAPHFWLTMQKSVIFHNQFKRTIHLFNFLMWYICTIVYNIHSFKVCCSQRHLDFITLYFPGSEEYITFYLWGKNRFIKYTVRKQPFSQFTFPFVQPLVPNLCCMRAPFPSDFPLNVFPDGLCCVFAGLDD